MKCVIGLACMCYSLQAGLECFDEVNLEYVFVLRERYEQGVFSKLKKHLNANKLVYEHSEFFHAWKSACMAMTDGFV